jgi:Threonine dehydrogenase and related Zn-dependent dehydrogenases
MKAVQMVAVKELKVADMPMPEPAADEVLLKVMAVGVCGSDIPRINKYGAHTLPIVPGHEFAGEVVKVGGSVAGVKMGDRVCVAPLLPCKTCEWCARGEFSLCDTYSYYGSRRDGAFAEYLAVKAENTVNVGDLPYDWAAMVDPAANAFHAMLRGAATGADTLCVYGLGSIGLFAIQMAKAMGMKQIFAVDIHDEKAAIAKQCGADHFINSLHADPVAAIREHTGGGVTLVMEMSGAPVAQQQAVATARKLGRVVFLGISHADLTLPEKAVDAILRGQLTVAGSWNSFSNPFPGREWTESVTLMREGKIHPEYFLSDKYPLEEAPAVFRRIADDRGFVFEKIMFYPHGLPE